MGYAIAGRPDGRVNDTPLTAEQRALAGAYLPLARSLARAAAKAHPSLAAEFESAAGLALVLAARSFVGCPGCAFSTHARRRVRWSFAEVLRGVCGTTPFDLIERGVEGLIPDGRQPPRSIVDDEELDRRLRVLPARHARLCRLIYRDGRTCEEAGRALGIGPTRSSVLHGEAIEMLRGEARDAAP